jgi:superfamily II DNA or RNA helicase
MKVEIKGKHLWFVDYSVSEFNKLEKLLTWEDQFAKSMGKTVAETLLFRNEDSGEYYTFFGLAELLKEQFKNFEIIFNDRDDEIQSLKVTDDILENITLRDYQVMAIRKAVNLKQGLIEIPTAGGKTEIALGISRLLMQNKMVKKVLIITPSLPICKQFRKRALIRGFKDRDVGLVYGGEKTYDRPITVAVINSLANGIKDQNPNVLNLITGADVIIMDEAHHGRSNSFLQVAYMSESEYLIGLSGTPFKDRGRILDDIGDSIIYGLIGRVILKVSQRTLVEKGYIADTVIYMKNVNGSFKKYKGRWNVIYNREITDHDIRNSYIINYCNTFAKQGLSVLVSVNVKNHAITLMKGLRKQHPNLRAICIFGGSKALIYNETGIIEEYQLDQEAFFEDFENGMYDVILASQVMDEGVDLPSVGALIFAAGGRSLRQVRQRLGRGVRSKKTGKNEVFILDFFDRGHVYMYHHSRKRLAIYLDEVESDVLEYEKDFLDLIESCQESEAA